MSKRSKISLSQAVRTTRSSPYPPFPKKAKLSDPHAWLDAFRPHELSTSEKRAFQTFGLNPQNPYHWARLSFILLDLHFSGRKAGKPPKWSSKELCALLRAIAAVRLRKPPRAKDVDVYKALVRK